MGSEMCIRDRLMCEKHGGGVTLENREGGGARVVARFSLDFCAE